MKYPKESFYTNFVGAYMSKDREITKDLIFNELAQIIVTKRKDVITMLTEIGIKFSKKPTDKEIVDAIIDNLSDDRRVDIVVAYLISEKNKKYEESFSNAGGEFWTKLLGYISGGGSTAGSGTTTTTGGTSTIGGIAGIISSIFSYAQSAKEIKAQKEADKQALLQQILAYKTAKEGSKGSNTAVYVILGLVVVGGLIGMYLYLKSVKPKSNPNIIRVK